MTIFIVVTIVLVNTIDIKYIKHNTDPFQSGLKTFIPETLDLDKMNRAAQQFMGTHDFTGFVRKNW